MDQQRTVIWKYIVRPEKSHFRFISFRFSGRYHIREVGTDKALCGHESTIPVDVLHGVTEIKSHQVCKRCAKAAINKDPGFTEQDIEEYV